MIKAIVFDCGVHFLLTANRPILLSSLSRLQKKYNLILLTNTFQQGYEGLKAKFGIDQIFSTIITSFESHKIKPDIQLFKDAVAHAGGKPSEIVMVGDNLHDDIEPAQTLGLRAILLDRMQRYPSLENRVTTMEEIENLYKTEAGEKLDLGKTYLQFIRRRDNDLPRLKIVVHVPTTTPSRSIAPIHIAHVSFL